MIDVWGLACDEDQGVNHLDSLPGTVDSVVADLLDHYWEGSNQRGFMLLDAATGSCVAMLVTVNHYGPHSGQVAITSYGNGYADVRLVKVSYVMRPDQRYERTEVV